MKLKDLAKKLAAKSGQEDEVEFIVFHPGGDLVCVELEGPYTLELMKLLAKYEKKRKEGG